METVFWTAAFLAMMSLEFPGSEIRQASLPASGSPHQRLPPAYLLGLPPIPGRLPRTAECAVPVTQWSCPGDEPESIQQQLLYKIPTVHLLSLEGPNSSGIWWQSWRIGGSGPKIIQTKVSSIACWLLQLFSRAVPLLHCTLNHSNLRHSVLISTQRSLHFSLLLSVQSLSVDPSLRVFRQGCYSTTYNPWGSLPSGSESPRL